MTRAAYRGQSSISSISIWTSVAKSPISKDFMDWFIDIFSNNAISRATPKWLKQSPLFGVKSISIISFPLELVNLEPISQCSENIIIPLWLLLIPSSFSEQIIPFDTTPLIFAFLIVKFPLSSVAPGNATGTRMPGSTLLAPQTISTVLSPTSTLHKFRWSESSTLVTDNIFPITIPEKDDTSAL